MIYIIFTFFVKRKSWYILHFCVLLYISLYRY